MPPRAPGTFALRLALASVWLLFGVGFKLLNLVPRHRAIVAVIVGEASATSVTRLIGAGEALLGLWVLSGRWPRTCALVQTVAIVTMNVLELRHARELLLAPTGMLAANALVLAAAWWLALRSPETQRPVA